MNDDLEGRGELRRHGRSLTRFLIKFHSSAQSARCNSWPIPPTCDLLRSRFICRSRLCLRDDISDRLLIKYGVEIKGDGLLCQFSRGLRAKFLRDSDLVKLDRVHRTFIVDAISLLDLPSAAKPMLYRQMASRIASNGNTKFSGLYPRSSNLYRNKLTAREII